MHFLLRLALLLCAVAPAWPAAAPRVPNLIYIVSDDQGFDLACFGSKQFVTPHLDRMAAEGVRATNFYVTASVCTPSRSGAITGRYPQRNGTYEMIRNNMVNYGHRYTKSEYAISPEMTLGLDVRELTFGDVLRTAGYHNACFGKWDMGQARRFLPLQRGFDVFVGHGNNGIDYYTHERYGAPSLFRGNALSPADRGAYATEIFRREAVGFIRENRARPGRRRGNPRTSRAAAKGFFLGVRAADRSRRSSRPPGVSPRRRRRAWEKSPAR